MSNETISKFLDGKPEFTVIEAYKRLENIAEDMDSYRDYLSIVYISANGYAIATDAHVMAILKLSEAETPENDFGLPVVPHHKTDDLSLKEIDGEIKLKVECEHKTDKSGIYDLADHMQFPNCEQVIPGLDYISESDNYVSFFSYELLHKLGEAICPEGSTGIALSVHETDSYQIVESMGFGILMPMRRSEDTIPSVLFELEGGE